MSKKCVYCSSGLSPESVVDICHNCGTQVWGEKMFNTIVQNMENASENNDLCATNMDPSLSTNN